MTKKFFFLFFLLFLGVQVIAQHNKQLSVQFNRSFHGTGDMSGVAFSVEYGKFFKKRWEITAALGSSIHHDEFPVLLTWGNGTTADASLRFVTAGIQLGSQFHFALVRLNRHELKLGAGPLLRYQSSSHPGAYSFHAPSQTMPEPVFSFRHWEKQNLITAGYLVSSSYAFNIRKCFFGIQASFQNDTNGDVITSYGVRIGKRF